MRSDADHSAGNETIFRRSLYLAPCADLAVDFPRLRTLAQPLHLRERAFQCRHQERRDVNVTRSGKPAQLRTRALSVGTGPNRDNAEFVRTGERPFDSKPLSDSSSARPYWDCYEALPAIDKETMRALQPLVIIFGAFARPFASDRRVASGATRSLLTNSESNG
jgi:hypothetical protein